MNIARSVLEAREAEILRLLHENGKIYCTALCEKFGVSSMTIRRTLEQMEQKGLLVRFHGGAAPTEEAAPEEVVPEAENESAYLSLSSVVQERISHNGRQKDIIAREAAKYIEPGEVVFMNSGTTDLYVLKYLGGKNVRIVTNNAAMALIERPLDMELTLSGGEHFARTQSFVGPLAKSVFSNVIASKCLMSVSGISSRQGITCACLQETEINNMMISQCRGMRIVVADGSKIGTAYDFISCKVTDIDMLITDKTADPVEIEKLRACGIRVIIADQ